jgi:hypothetical protein
MSHTISPFPGLVEKLERFAAPNALVQILKHQNVALLDLLVILRRLELEGFSSQPPPA